MLWSVGILEHLDVGSLLGDEFDPLRNMAIVQLLVSDDKFCQTFALVGTTCEGSCYCRQWFLDRSRSFGDGDCRGSLVVARRRLVAR